MSSRSIQNHILNDETVLEYFMGTYWGWVATDRRIIKYRQTDSGAEEMRDVSYDDISGISLTHQGRNTTYILAAAISGLLGLLLIESSGAAGIGLLCIAALPAYLWMNSESSYFEFKGVGLVRDEPEEWRIEATSVDNEDDLNKFIRAVRSQI